MIRISWARVYGKSHFRFDDVFGLGTGERGKKAVSAGAQGFVQHRHSIPVQACNPPKPQAAHLPKVKCEIEA